MNREILEQYIDQLKQESNAIKSYQNCTEIQAAYYQGRENAYERVIDDLSSFLDRE